MSFFPDLRAKKLRLFAQMEAMEAKKEGLVAADVSSETKNKPSIGKILFFLGGLGAIVGYTCFSDEISAFLGNEPQEKKKLPLSLLPSAEKRNDTPKDESKKLIEKIKMYQMEEEKRLLSSHSPSESSTDWIKY
jgi:hypothetical protein